MTETNEERQVSSITITDPEFIRIWGERPGPSASDIPMYLNLGHTKDGRTREDFEDEDDFLDLALKMHIDYATIAQVDDHLTFEGNEVRLAFARLMGLMAIRDKILELANGDTSAKFIDLLNEHFGPGKDHKNDTDNLEEVER